jgi:hypothetical protein
VSEPTFTSSVPGIYTGLLKLVREAGAEQSQEVAVFPFELNQYKPGSYVILGPLKGPTYEWEAIPLQVREIFDITGKAIVYKGETPTAEENQQLATEALTEVFSVMVNCLMTPALANRGAPTFGTSGPSAQITVPLEARHEAGPGIIEGTTGGWMSVIDWGIHFESILNPVPALP